MIISSDEIFILLNQYYLQGVNEISFFYPLIETRLFTLNYSKMRIENVVSGKDFDYARRKYARSEFLRKELADYRDLIDVFLSSGILDFENQDEIEENFDLLRKAVSDRTIYIKPVFIAIDTNIAYYRIISRRFRNHFKYVVSNIVVDEVDAKIHTKYNARMIREFERLPYRNMMYEFANASSKNARKAKNALNEIYYLTNKLDAFRIGESTRTEDKEIRDREIVKQYRSFSDEINAEVILLTADKDMVFHAQANQLSSIYFKLPHSLRSSYEVDPVLIPNLIYDLVLVFGVIRIGNTVLLGEWRGKSSEDYFQERLKIYNVDPDLAKDVEICRGVIHELQRDES